MRPGSIGENLQFCLQALVLGKYRFGAATPTTIRVSTRVDRSNNQPTSCETENSDQERPNTGRLRIGSFSSSSGRPPSLLFSCQYRPKAWTRLLTWESH